MIDDDKDMKSSNVLAHVILLPILGLLIFKSNGDLEWSWWLVIIACIGFFALMMGFIFVKSFIDEFGFIDGFKFLFKIKPKEKKREPFVPVVYAEYCYSRDIIYQVFDDVRICTTIGQDGHYEINIVEKDNPEGFVSALKNMGYDEILR